MIPRSGLEEESSVFARSNVKRLLSHYCLTYYREEACAEYFLADQGTREIVSRSLVLSYSPFSRNLCIVKFYPELYIRENTKYLSAACLYLMVHHFSRMVRIGAESKISLNTQPDVFHNFYAKLGDFNFQILRICIGDTLELISDFCPADLDTDMVTQEVSCGLPQPVHFCAGK